MWLCRYHTAVLFASLLFSVVLVTVSDERQPIYAQDNYLSMCWIKRFRNGSSNASAYFYALFVVPLAVVYLVSLSSVSTDDS